MFRGHKEADIRRELIRRGLIKGIIGLPENLFYGTGIPACIIVIDKEKAGERDGIFMIDASKGYMKDGNKNRLRSRDIHKIVDVFNKFSEQEGYSRYVPLSEIKDPANDYNLNIPRYIDGSDPEDHHDLEAHLHGGIPQKDIDALQEYWKVLPSLRTALFTDNGRPGYLEAKLNPEEVKSSILEHDEFQNYSAEVAQITEKWMNDHRAFLCNLEKKSVPKQVIHTLSDDLLARFSEVSLLNRYDVYQQLMDYWAEEMQDDVYLIAAAGWAEAAQPRGIIDDKERKIKETADLTIGKHKYKTDLIPPERITDRYFAEDKKHIETLQAEHEKTTRELEEFTEEHTGEGNLLENALNTKNTVTKTAVKERLKNLDKEPDEAHAEERETLNRCLELIDKEGTAQKALNDAQKKLDKKALDKYGELTEDDIKTLVIDDKWFTTIRDAIQGEVNRLTQQLAERVKELEERYAEPLPHLEEQVNAYSRKVEEHLKNMGVQ